MTITINGNGTVTGVSVGGLPDGIVDTDMLAANAVTDAKTSLNTITEVDQWRINTTANTSDSFLTANWERNDTSGFQKIGTGMSESSGVFTFPSTGKWKIFYHAVVAKSSAAVRYVGGQIQYTINNSAYTPFAQAYANLFNDGTSCWGAFSTEAFVDVTDLSNCKVKFHVGAATSIDFVGTSTENYTYAIFTRLGDT